MSRQLLTADRWRDLVGQQRRSGLSVESFCGKQALAVSTFFVWRRKLQDRSAPTFVELTPVVEPPGPRPRVSGSWSPNEPIELLLPGGAIVRVGAGFDTGTLRSRGGAAMTSGTSGTSGTHDIPASPAPQASCHAFDLMNISTYHLNPDVGQFYCRQ